MGPAVLGVCSVSGKHRYGDWKNEFKGYRDLLSRT
jgi:hypothetical protein